MEWCVGFFPLLKLMTAFSLSAKAHYNFVPNKGDPISSSYSHQSPIMMTWHLSRSKGQKMPYLLPYSSVCRMVPTQLSICNRRRATYNRILLAEGWYLCVLFSKSKLGWKMQWHRYTFATTFKIHSKRSNTDKIWFSCPLYTYKPVHNI